jgi:uncharacterized repeat protein (TIGR02543 family)
MPQYIGWNVESPGYTFAGWNTRADGSGTSYTQGQSVSNLASTQGAVVTLYAQWTVITYTITYDLWGGTNAAANPTSYTIESPDITLAPPTRAGYTFEGWNCSDDFGWHPGVAGIPAGSTGNKTFSTQWMPITYTVQYNPNGGTGGSSETHTYGMPQYIGWNVVRDGYTFAGWNTRADGGGTSYTQGQSVSNLASTQGAVVTLYAQWTVITYTITYDLSGGTNAAGNPTSYTIESPAITLAPPTRAGYTFEGWDCSDDFGWHPNVTGIPTGSTGSRAFFAKWSRDASLQIELQPALWNPPLSNESISEDQAASFSTNYAYSSYAWYWDGEAISGTNTNYLYIDPNSKPPGIYEVSVVVTTDTGETLSARCRVTINKAR